MRRTDKVAAGEAALTPDSKYIEALENYKIRFGIEGNLTVYIASDTSETVAKFREKYCS